MGKTVALREARGVASLLLALARRIFKLDDSLAAALPLAQLRVCGLLYDAPRPMSALSRELGVSLSAMTQIADRLERARLVKRIADGTDRRIRSLQLTPRGQRLMRRHEEARIRRVAAVLGQVPPAARRKATAALRTLVTASAASSTRDGAAKSRRRSS